MYSILCYQSKLTSHFHFQNIEDVDKKSEANEKEVIVISMLKNEFDNSLEKMTQNIVNLQYKMDQSNSNFYNLETKIDKSDRKLAYLSRSLSTIKKSIKLP